MPRLTGALLGAGLPALVLTLAIMEGLSGAHPALTPIANGIIGICRMLGADSILIGAVALVGWSAASGYLLVFWVESRRTSRLGRGE